MTDTGPKVFLNYLSFDANYVAITDPTQTNFVRITTAAKETGTDIVHERMYAQVVVKQAGYMYIYYSNEDASGNYEAYFDDFTVTHTKFKVYKAEDYYPFGLAMDGNTYTDPYRYGYQGQYSEKDNLTGLNEFELRMYEPRFGRWISPDPYGQFVSPYIGMGNSPHTGVDPDGGFFDKVTVGAKAARRTTQATRLARNGSTLLKGLGKIGADVGKFLLNNQTAVVSGFRTTIYSGMPPKIRLSESSMVVESLIDWIGYMQNNKYRQNDFTQSPISVSDIIIDDLPWIKKMRLNLLSSATGGGAIRGEVLYKSVDSGENIGSIRWMINDPNFSNPSNYKLNIISNYIYNPESLTYHLVNSSGKSLIVLKATTKAMYNSLLKKIGNAIHKYKKN